MAKRQPEGLIKDDCRKDAESEGRLFWQIEGKSRNGIPDTLAERLRGGVIFIEFKRPGKEPTEQQYVRIAELRNAGIEAWWCDSFEGYRRLIAGDYEVKYPQVVWDTLKIMGLD